jgi:transcriptional regulator with XRE-family HTH domain
MMLGENIKARREAAGLSQNELAKLAHINQSGLSKIERDTNENVTIGTLRAIARVLRCSVGNLLPNEDKDVRYKALADRIKALEACMEHKETA